jgi:hypothetical protein
MRKWIFGIAAAVLVVAGVAALWYRATYYTWPGAPALSRIHWCGRDYEDEGSGRRPSGPLELVGHYPPISPRQDLYMSPGDATHASTSCTVVLYLKVSPTEYRIFALEGGP